MAAPFEFSEIQANDILEMQLRQLTRLTRIDLQTELDDVRGQHHRAAGDPRLPRAAPQRHQDEMTAIKEEFATPRVCEIDLRRRRDERSRTSSTTRNSSS